MAESLSYILHIVTLLTCSWYLFSQYMTETVSVISLSAVSRQAETIRAAVNRKCDKNFQNKSTLGQQFSNGQFSITIILIYIKHCHQFILLNWNFYFKNCLLSPKPANNDTKANIH